MQDYAFNSHSCKNISLLTDIDECLLGSFICEANTDCVNTVGGYDCVCSPGYTGFRNDCMSKLAKVDTFSENSTCFFNLFLLQMWMSVWKAPTTATLMLTAQTLLEVSSARVVLATLEMGLKTAQVRFPCHVHNVMQQIILFYPSLSRCWRMQWRHLHLWS